jgi:hypothetical protein
VLLGGHEEGGNRCRVVPLREGEAGSLENLPGLFTMLQKGVVVEGGEFVASLSIVLVVLLRFGCDVCCVAHDVVCPGVAPYAAEIGDYR